MNHRKLLGLSICGAMIALAAITAGGALAAGPSADYRFENSFGSSVGDAKKLDAVGPPRVCPPCETFAREKVKGKKQGVWIWPFQDGLRLGGAEKLMGHEGKTYTIAMLVRLDTTSDYRKLVDFDNRESEEGWYQYEQSLYPYDLADFDYSEQVINAGAWRQIVLTRDSKGVVRGYVDGEALGKAKDKRKDIALGEDGKLFFLMDDAGPALEASGGAIARLRIWKNALPNNKIRHLDP